jgi:hypothetical protein
MARYKRQSVCAPSPRQDLCQEHNLYVGQALWAPNQYQIRNSSLSVCVVCAAGRSCTYVAVSRLLY